MFGATIWTLLAQRSTQQVNYKMVTVACLLFLLSTAVRVWMPMLSDRDYVDLLPSTWLLILLGLWRD